MLIQSRYTEIVVIFFASTIWHLSDQVARVKCLTQAPKTTWDNMNNHELSGSVLNSDPQVFAHSL